MFYERYVFLCEGRGLTPSAGATKAGFNRGTVSVWKKKYEAKQDVVPEQNIIDKICAFFGCSESWLRGIEKAPTQDGEREITLDDFTYAMQNEYKNLTDADKQILLSMAKQLDDARKKKNGESE